ncbi:unnamed protein product [Cochlearia groenlandica]
MECLLCSPILYIFLVFIWCLVRVLLKRSLSLPPGPRGYPIIGNMKLKNELNHRGLAKLAKQYGGLLHLQMGRIHIVAASTAAMAREILQVQDVVFANRPANVAISYLTYNRADMAFANYGPLWRQMRKICVMKLFSRKRAESWASVREEIDLMVQTLKKHTEFLPWMRWFSNRGFSKRLENARISLDGFIDKIIDAHIEKKKCRKQDDDGLDDDMVDELMAFYSDQENADKSNNDSQSSLRLTRDNIKALVMDVMFGGTETVASAIEWAMTELMKNPQELKKVQQELADVIGLNRQFHESDMENLPYLRCAMKETLRLHPPIPLLLHEAAADSVVSGYSIPRDSRVMINVYAIGRDGSVWSEPDKFIPGRFMDSKAPDFKGSDFEFLPFGSGRRSCPGMQLGLYAMELAVAHMLHCFEWELPEGLSSGDLDMTDMFGLTAPRATRLIAVPSYRLKCPMVI